STSPRYGGSSRARGPGSSSTRPPASGGAGSLQSGWTRRSPRTVPDSMPPPPAGAAPHPDVHHPSLPSRGIAASPDPNAASVDPATIVCIDATRGRDQRADTQPVIACSTTGSIVVSIVAYSDGKPVF